MLLAVLAMACAVQSCVLPPPPLEEQVEATTLSLDYDKLKPLQKLPVALQRGESPTQVQFSVASAVQGDEGQPVKVFWYIDFDPNAPFTPGTVGGDLLGETISLTACDERFANYGDKAVLSVEALVTHGTAMVLVEKDGDPRVTDDGEPYVKASWSLRIDGADELCTAGGQ